MIAVMYPWLQAHVWPVAAFVALLVLASCASWILQRVLCSRLRCGNQAAAGVLHFEVVRRFVPLVSWGLLFAAISVGLHLLPLPDAAERLMNKALQAGFALLVAFAASAAAKVALNQWARASGDAAEERTRITLAPVLAKSCLIFFMTIAALLVLQNAGYNVAGLLAGLGIGGLAVALAAKETLANLFGSIALLMDRTFQVGDRIKQGDVEGEVVNIGLRSTRVRTKEGYIVSIPNQLMTNAAVTNMTPEKLAGGLDRSS
jgi:MscS family membrane protein